MDIEKRINNIFIQTDEYMKECSFNELTLEQVIFLVSDFSQTRRTRMILKMDKDEKLYELEKELRWLMGIMKERNIKKISR